MPREREYLFSLRPRTTGKHKPQCIARNRVDDKGDERRKVDEMTGFSFDHALSAIQRP